MLIVNALKARALEVLLRETFSYVRNNMHEAYAKLAKDNAKIQGVAHSEDVLFFQYRGKVYPNRTPTGASTKNTHVRAPLLHYSLIDRKENIDAMLEEAQYNQVRNFFVAVLKDSYNNIVLKEFLPVVLLSSLQKHFTAEEYEAIDRGTAPPMPPPLGDSSSGPSKETTLIAIQHIRQFYPKAIEQTKKLLMERFFLQ